MGVMGVKNGTKTFSTSTQNDIVKTDKTQNISAADMDQLNGEDIGAHLNKIADPNWVDPSRKIRAVGNDKMDKDAFMKLMLAQMKNQDPTNPLKSHEMAAQLAQFSSVEQMQNMNTTLTDIKNGQKPTEGFQALNFIGKAVSGDSSKLIRVKGDKDHDFSFNLPDDAKDVEIKVRNSGGEVVRTVELRDLKKGENRWTWNGQGEQGNAMPAGEYQFFIEAKNAGDKKLAVKTDFNGVITGLNYTPEGPVLLVGTQSVKLKDVKKIVDPSLMSNDQKKQIPATQDLKTQPAALENENKSEQVAGDPEFTQASNLDSVGMSRDMIDKLAKETRPSDPVETKQAVIKPETKEGSKRADASKPTGKEAKKVH